MLGRSPVNPPPAPRSVFDYSATLLDGRTIGLGEFRGRVLLIVNTASRCGFTPQYAGLEALHRSYRERGFAVLGFPSNQFGRQEPGTAAEIADFCRCDYEVSFPLFAKVEVNGRDAHPLYRFLKREKRGLFGIFSGGGISWNFTKFLVRRSGRVAARFSPATSPDALARPIEELLREPEEESGGDPGHEPVAGS
jgi:glutathione peroxidase